MGVIAKSNLENLSDIHNIVRTWCQISAYNFLSNINILISEFSICMQFPRIFGLWFLSALYQVKEPFNLNMVSQQILLLLFSEENS